MVSQVILVSVLAEMQPEVTFRKLDDDCSVIPGTFQQDQFTTNIDHQVNASNKLSGRFFFTNQPSADPLATSSALSLFERLQDTSQRTVSITDVHIFGPSLINEFRAGFFRNRNDTRARAHFTNAQLGINNPGSSGFLVDVRPAPGPSCSFWGTGIDHSAL